MSGTITAVDWKDCHKIGIDEIDREHEALVNDFNALLEAIYTTKDRSLIAKQALDFVRSNANHYANEEAHMIAAGYDDLDLHRERHLGFMNRLGHLCDKIASGNDVTEQMLTFFASWITHHVAVTDQKFGEFLKKSIFND